MTLNEIMERLITFEGNENTANNISYTDEEIKIIEDNLLSELESKLDGYYKYINKTQSKINSRKNEMNDLRYHNTRDAAKIERLKSAVAYHMQNTMKVKLIEGDLHKFRLRKSTSTKITDENQVPDKYKNEITEIKIDKMKLKDDLKLGLDVDGATLVENFNLMLK